MSNLVEVRAFAAEKGISTKRMMRLLRKHAPKHLIGRGRGRPVLVNRTHLASILPALVDRRVTTPEDLNEVSRELRRLKMRLDAVGSRERQFREMALGWFRRLGIPEAGR